MKKTHLFTPGPVDVPPEVLSAMAEPMIHHRAPEFTPYFVRANEGLQYIFRTENPVVMFAGSGTAAMEASVVNTLSPGDKAICVVGGKFGERWGQICAAYGINAIIIEVEWGHAVDPEKLLGTLRENPDVKAVFLTLTETSTGVLTDVETICKAIAETNAISVVDAVSALAAERLETDNWKVDMVVAGSQKALMLPPGLAFCSVSPKARALMDSARCSKFYLSLPKALKSLEKNDTAFTPAVSHIRALAVAADMIRKEGIENVWARHARLGKALREAARALGLCAFSMSPSNVVTAISIPEGVDGAAIPKILRDKHGVTIAGGQEHLKGKIIRIATLGWANDLDVITVIGALELTLLELGHKFEPGAGVGAVVRALSES
jgi:aspartate aminotransferase-like enzyme